MKEKALFIGRTALEKKASDVVILEVGALTTVADYFVFCSGSSERQVRAIADAIEKEVAGRFAAFPSLEGTSSATWILLDYRDIVVHVFREDIRAYYGIEKMWRDAKQIPRVEYDQILSPHSRATHTSPSPVAVPQAS